jgi:hypothetical protein
LAEPGKFTTDPLHQHSPYRRVIQRNLDYLSDRSRLIDKHTGTWAEAVIKQRGPIGSGTPVAPDVWAYPKGVRGFETVWHVEGHYFCLTGISSGSNRAVRAFLGLADYRFGFKVLLQPEDPAFPTDPRLFEPTEPASLK